MTPIDTTPLLPQSCDEGGPTLWPRQTWFCAWYSTHTHTHARARARPSVTHRRWRRAAPLHTAATTTRQANQLMRQEGMPALGSTDALTRAMASGRLCALCLQLAARMGMGVADKPNGSIEREGGHAQLIDAAMGAPTLKPGGWRRDAGSPTRERCVAHAAPRCAAAFRAKRPPPARIQTRRGLTAQARRVGGARA